MEQTKASLERDVPKHGAISNVNQSGGEEKPMKHAKTISILVVLAVVSGVVGASWALANFGATDAPSDESTPETMPKFEIQEKVRSDAMAYIAANHPETSQFMTNLTWTGGAVETFAPPETYVYNAQGWNVMVEFPLEGSQTYKVTVGYTSQGMGIPYSVSWSGSWVDGNITETQYCFVQ